eukprot:4844646-Prymnesium_polylepis.1
MFGIDARSHACEAGFGVGQGNVSVHIKKRPCYPSPPAGRSGTGLGHERLIFGTVGEDDWLVLA